MIGRNRKSRLSTAITVIVLAIPMAAMAQPSPSSWDITSLVPGNPVSASHPWEVLEASGATCGTTGVALEMPSELQGKLCQAPRRWMWAQRFIDHGQTQSISWVLVCGWPGDAVTL